MRRPKRSIATRRTLVCSRRKSIADVWSSQRLVRGSLADAVPEGSERERFRRDLYFRLAVILLRLPPLRERGEDVLTLAQHFLRRFSAKYGRPVERLDPRARERLLAYPWPGNVRELSHVIERAVLWSQGPMLDVEHLALDVPPERAEPFAEEDAADARPV